MMGEHNMKHVRLSNSPSSPLHPVIFASENKLLVAPRKSSGCLDFLDHFVASFESQKNDNFIEW